jgi:hypothetical protein
MAKYESFLKGALGEHGYTAINNAIAQAPEIKDAVPAQAILSWVESAARVSYEGNVPGTAHVVSFAKSEDGFVCSFDSGKGKSGSTKDIATLLARVLEFAPASAPSAAINKSQTEQLVKTIDLLVKMNLVKAFGIKPHGEAAPPASPMSQTGAKQPTPAQPKQPKTKIPKMGSGATATKTSTIAQNRTQTPMAAGMSGQKAAGTKQKQTAGKTPKVSALAQSETQKPCPSCGNHAFTSSRFVGCPCFGELAKSTYSKAVQDGFVVFFNFQWDEESINKLVGYYKG